MPVTVWKPPATVASSSTTKRKTRNGSGATTVTTSGDLEGIAGRAVELSVDLGDLGAPAPALRVLQRHQLLARPVEVVGDEGHLLVELVDGVGLHHASPTRCITGSSSPLSRS